jgi:DNA-binding SARP family transcriptional activator
VYPRANRDDSLAIQLLGSPTIRRGPDGDVRLRGFKAWGLLAYLLRAEAPVTREHAVSLLFTDADDPLAALRWNLTEVRRALGDPAAVRGDPLRLDLAAGAVVDVDVLIRGSWPEALQVSGLGRDLLEGMSFAASPAFEAWVLTERRYMHGVAEGVLREAVLARLASGDTDTATQLAGRLVTLNVLDESSQALLVRCLALSGKRAEAIRQIERCTELFKRELGTVPGNAVTSAVNSPGAAIGSSGSGHAAARAQLEAGRAAVGAGALDAGMSCLRRAVVEAQAGGHGVLEAEALLELGSALVHAARGRDIEGAPALHKALQLATEAGVAGVAAAAARELGYIDFLGGRYVAATKWARRAAEIGADDQERGRIGCLLGAIRSDVGSYERAISELGDAADLSRRSKDVKQEAYTLSMLGRAHLLQGDLSEAEVVLDRSLKLSRSQNWTAFVAWPTVLRGDVDLARADVASATERYEYAFALGRQLEDPCWEGMACRGLGLVAAAHGDMSRAVDLLLDAQKRCSRLPDAYLWVRVYALDALCGLAVLRRLPAAALWIDQLTNLAARAGMRGMVVRAFAYRDSLGDDAMSAVKRAVRIANTATPMTRQGFLK